MPLTQRRLHAEAVRRLREARPELVRPAGEPDLAALLAVREAVAAEPGADAAQAVAVVHHLDPVAWVREAAVLALGLPPGTAAAWRRSFTRTVYLAGNPRNLLGRYSFDHLAEDGSVGWCAPAPAGSTAGLRRLLKLFTSTAPFPVRPPGTVTVPSVPARHDGPTRAPVHRDVYVAVSGVPLPLGLVHLNHLVVEAVLDGLVAPGDRLTLRSVPSLAGADIPFAALRVDVDRAHPHQLRAYAALTEETPHE
ncbi:DUF6182 family protein [Streptomyces sp. cg36]|uniref:DUF6182 family protein n=1 Tax=Streptomyces sp. cg36 TaxID=3238798 RepID=UPI0034E2A2B4